MLESLHLLSSESNPIVVKNFANVLRIRHQLQNPQLIYKINATH